MQSLLISFNLSLTTGDMRLLFRILRSLPDSEKWCTLRELLGTVKEGSNAQVAEFIGDAEIVIFDFRT